MREDNKEIELQDFPVWLIYLYYVLEIACFDRFIYFLWSIPSSSYHFPLLVNSLEREKTRKVGKNHAKIKTDENRIILRLD